MTPDDMTASERILSEIHEVREMLGRIDERQQNNTRRLDAVEREVGSLTRFRWWILGGLGAAGTTGGAIGAQLAEHFTR